MTVSKAAMHTFRRTMNTKLLRRFHNTLTFDLEDTTAGASGGFSHVTSHDIAGDVGADARTSLCRIPNQHMPDFNIIAIQLKASRLFVYNEEGRSRTGNSSQHAVPFYLFEAGS
jgi:hypothetical protein